jgi:prevent-host-death family protein
VITQTTAGALRQNLGEMLGQVHRQGDSIIISEGGQPVAALVDIALFERIQRLQNRFDQLSARFAKAFATVTEPEGTAEIEALMVAERSGPTAAG